MKKIKIIIIASFVLICSCVKIPTDSETNSKNSSASTRIGNSQSGSKSILQELD